MLDGGGDDPYGTENIDFWESFDVKSVDVHFDDLRLYGSDNSILKQSRNLTKYINFTQLQRNFMNNYPLSPDINYELTMEDDYMYKNLCLNFNMFEKSNELVSPVMASDNKLLERGTLKINIQFDTEESITSGLFVFAFIYDSYRANLELDEGNIINPLFDL